MNRLLVLAFLCLGVALMATSTHAAPCQGRTTSYWGHYNIHGGTFCYWGGGPPQEPQLIGQTTRDCNGNLSSWGNTTCEMYPPTVEYFDCDCDYASSEPVIDGQAKPAACTAERAAE